MAEAGPAGLGARAAFAVAAFGLVVAGIFALERVGAPDGLVAALGPLLALAGVATVGILTRTKTLLDFFVARRAAPPWLAGLAMAAAVGGVALGLAGSPLAASTLPWRGFGLGAALALVALAPHWRATEASALSDVFATRFPSAFARTAFALVLAACGLSFAASGLGYAALSLQGAFGVGPNFALLLSALALIASLAPGGLRSLIWTDAASAGAALLAIGLFAARSAATNPDAGAAASRSLSDLPAAPLVQEIAAFAAMASLIVFVTPAFAVASAGAARRAGVAALAALALGGLAAASLGGLDLKGPGDSSLAGLVACLPAMALGRAGLYAAARAVGLDLRRAHTRLWILASRRLAVVRVAVVAGAFLAADAARASAHPSAPLFLGLALWLAFAAPSLALTALPGRSALPATAALCASVAATALARLLGLAGADGLDLMVGGFGAGLVGFAAGLVAFALHPDPSPRRAADPFVDLPRAG